MTIETLADMFLEFIDETQRYPIPSNVKFDLWCSARRVTDKQRMTLYHALCKSGVL